MTTRYEWAHLPRVEFMPEGYDVASGEPVPDLKPGEVVEGMIVNGGGLVLSYDEAFVITGTPDELVDWCERAITTIKAATEQAAVAVSGIVLTREQLDAWAERTLTDDEVAELDEAIPNSSIPQAIGEISDYLPSKPDEEDES